MRGLIAARTAVMTAVGAIDADMRRMARASVACRRLMTIPGVGQLTALAFVAAIDDPSPEHAALVLSFPRRMTQWATSRARVASRTKRCAFAAATKFHGTGVRLLRWGFAIGSLRASRRRAGRLLAAGKWTGSGPHPPVHLPGAIRPERSVLRQGHRLLSLLTAGLRRAQELSAVDPGAR
jgi:transposase